MKWYVNKTNIGHMETAMEKHPQEHTATLVLNDVEGVIMQ